MKKVTTVIIVLILAYCLCSCQSGGSQTILSLLDSNESPQNNESVSDQSSIYHDESLCYPLFFVDTEETANDAYVLCAFESKELMTTSQYKYNDQELTSFVFQGEPVSVVSDIVDTAKLISFYETNGDCATVDINDLKCKGEVLLGSAHVLANIGEGITVSGKRYIGTYSNINIFPQDIEFKEQEIRIDMDFDGKDEYIKWSFSPASDIYGEHYFNYTVLYENDGKVITVEENGTSLPIEKRDIDVFIVDIDMDSNFEIIVYTKKMSRFRQICIYDLDTRENAVEFMYIIDPEP